MTDKKFKKVVGLEIKRIRKEVGWSQTKLGRKIGLSQTSVSRLELGKDLLIASRWLHLCRATKTPPSRLLSIKGLPARRLAGAVSR